MSGRVTQSFGNVMGTGKGLLVTQHHASVMGQSNEYRRRFTQLYASVMGKQPLNVPEGEGSNRVTQVWANVLIPFAPNFEWIDMVIDEVFPFDISYESIGATRFQTDVVMVDSGHDQRLSRWEQPLMEYDVAYGVRTMEHLHGLIAFFRAVKGRKYAFLYKDIVDHTSTLAVAEEARRSPEISPRDQTLGIGDHRRKRFQLIKSYPSPSGHFEQIRPIYRPMPGTVMVAVNGLQVDNWTCDYARGVITFVTDWSRLNLQSMRMEPVEGEVQMWSVTSPNPDFGGLRKDDKIVMRGWLNPLNNSTEDIDLVVQSVAANSRSFVIAAPERFGEFETNRNGIDIYRHPAPPPNSVITAGFHFYVPVRFDTDRLPVALEEYGVGGAADVRLVEVRATEIFDT